MLYNLKLQNIKFNDPKVQRLAILGLLGIALAVGAVLFYKKRTVEYERRAQKNLAESLELYRQAVYIQGLNTVSQDEKSALWQEVQLAFSAGFKHAASSNLAPYFLAFWAEALIVQGQREQANDVMQQMADLLSTHAPLYALYSLKHALIKMDMPDEATRQDGLKQLEALAHDKKNYNFDAALYQLGVYYLSIGDSTRAYALFNELITSAAAKNDESPSPWAGLAKKLVPHEPQ